MFLGWQPLDPKYIHVFWSPVENRRDLYNHPRSFVRSSVRAFVSVDLGNAAYKNPDFFHEVGDKYG